MTLKGELPRSVGAQYATGEKWRNKSRKNEGMEPKHKQYPVVDVAGDRSKVWCCKEQYCIGTWNVSFMNQGNCKWLIPGTEEPGGLPSMASHRVKHYWVTSLSLLTFMHWRRKWQPTPLFLPGESQGRGSLVGCRLWGHTESDTTEVTWQQQQQHYIYVKMQWLLSSKK